MSIASDPRYEEPLSWQSIQLLHTISHISYLSVDLMSDLLLVQFYFSNCQGTMNEVVDLFREIPVRYSQYLMIHFISGPYSFYCSGDINLMRRILLNLTCFSIVLAFSRVWKAVAHEFEGIWTHSKQVRLDTVRLG